MRIRHRLSLAFFGVSVLPLAVVTAYSYHTSAAALRRAAEAQADQMAAEMGERMTWVLADLGERVQRIWHMRTSAASGPDGAPRSPGTLAPTATDVTARRGPAQTAPAPGAAVAGAAGITSTGNAVLSRLQREVRTALAEAAPIVERLEFVPVPEPPAPPAPPEGPGEGSRARSGADRQGGRRGPDRGLGRPPGKPAPDPRVVVDFSVPGAPPPPRQRRVVPFGAPDRESVEAWRRAIQQQIDQDRQARAAVAPAAQQRAAETRERAKAPEAARRAEWQHRQAELQQRLRSVASGDAVRFVVNVDGAVVGEVSANINRHRMIETVLGLARRERGEVPFVLDVDDEIHTVGPEDGRTIEGFNLDRAALAALPGQSSKTIGDWVIVTRHDESGIVFGIARPLGDSLRDMRMAAASNLGLGLLLIVGAFAGILPLASRLTRHLTTLTDGVDRLARGERGTRVAVDTRDEVGDLARAFNRMAGDLEAHEKILVERERLRRELELCRQIQTDMLPHGTLRLGLAEVSGVSIPAREVGGDFFNYFALADGTIALIVGDVSGKGVGAAILMANVQATLRARVPLELDLPTLVDAIDRDVAENTPAEVYLTLFIGILDPAAGTLRYVNGGHNTQFLLRAGGGIESLEATGLPVGLLPGRGYAERALPVSAGDLLFLYTDGATEVENAEGDMFGPERLQQALTAAPASGVAEVLVSVEAAIAAFRGDSEPADDATMMAVRVGSGLGSGPASRGSR